VTVVERSAGGRSHRPVGGALAVPRTGIGHGDASQLREARRITTPVSGAISLPDDWAPPHRLETAAARLALAPWTWLTGPRFYGLRHLRKDRPALLVGNHTVMGLVDAPLMVLGILRRRGIAIRSLGDHVHFRIPGWRALLAHWGVVEGTPEACRALMRRRETILVFPGGAREVFKRKGEKYRLLWGDRLGFVRLAVEHGYPIVPFGAVGAEECFDILLDAGDVLATPLVGALLQRFVPRIDELPPLVRGLGPTPLPRPERFYFAFGSPIETCRLVGRQDDAVLCAAVRDQVRAAVEGRIAFLLAERHCDPDRALVARMLHRLGGRSGAPP
jgi:1-acyl-sn-glycerol-3-phosphate acyltransferase